MCILYPLFSLKECYFNPLLSELQAQASHTDMVSSNILQRNWSCYKGWKNLLRSHENCSSRDKYLLGNNVYSTLPDL